MDIFEKITAKLKFQQEDWVQITVLAVWDIEYLGSGMLGIWDLGDVECFGSGILGIWDAFDMEYLGYEMFGMWKVFYVGCSRSLNSCQFICLIMVYLRYCQTIMML